MSKDLFIVFLIMILVCGTILYGIKKEEDRRDKLKVLLSIVTDDEEDDAASTQFEVPREGAYRVTTHLLLYKGRYACSCDVDEQDWEHPL